MKHTAETLQAAFKYLWPDEVPLLKSLARSLPDNPTVINIGAGSGTSGLAFMESRPDLHLVTIDTEDQDSPLGSLYSERLILEEAGLWGERNEQIKGDSKKIGAIWPTFAGPVNMVFVDGEHSYEGCAGDILAWLPHIKPGGIMAVHDYKKMDAYKVAHNKDDVPHPMPWPGVDQAVDDLLLRQYEILSWVNTLIAFRITK